MFFFFFQHMCLIEQTSFGFCNTALFLAMVGWLEDWINTLNRVNWKTVTYFIVKGIFLSYLYTHSSQGQ